MSSNQQKDYAHYKKNAWIIYTLATLSFIAILVLFVARDNEEIFFYTIMPAAAAYVLRPTDKTFAKYILKYTGVSKPSEED